MNIEQARFNMIEQQIRTWDVLDLDVLNLLQVVKREEFVPAAYKSLAFADTEIPLSKSASMFFPRMEARILQELAPKKHERVLEIGTGSGYMAALFAHRARHVTTVEIDPALKKFAEENLARAGITNVDVVEGNGAHGWDDGKEYDVIFLCGSVPALPESYLHKLNVGGRMLTIIGTPPVMTTQLSTRVGTDSFQHVKLFETVVKPLQDAPTPPRFKF